MPIRTAVILAVEDEPTDVLLLRTALRKANVKQPLRSVRDGQEAMDYLEGRGRYADRERHPLPCILLLDVHLPRINGLELLRWLRCQEDFKDLPVLMITSSDEPEHQKVAHENGVEAYCVKPVAFDELVRLAHDVRRSADGHCESSAPCPSEAVQDE